MQLELPPTARAAGIARQAIVAELPDRSPEAVNAVVLLVSELVTNSVRHGGLGPQGTVELSMQALPHSIRVEVTDSGPGFRPGSPLPDPDEGGSLGLLLVERLSDAWGVSNDPCRVWFEVATTPGPPAAL